MIDLTCFIVSVQKEMEDREAELEAESRAEFRQLVDSKKKDDPRYVETMIHRYLKTRRSSPKKSISVSIQERTEKNLRINQRRNSLKIPTDPTKPELDTVQETVQQTSNSIS